MSFLRKTSLRVPDFGVKTWVDWIEIFGTSNDYLDTRPHLIFFNPLKFLFVFSRSNRSYILVLFLCLKIYTLRTFILTRFSYKNLLIKSLNDIINLLLNDK